MQAGFDINCEFPLQPEDVYFPQVVKGILKKCEIHEFTAFILHSSYLSFDFLIKQV